VPGKWGLHTFYSRDRGIRPYLPPTALLKQKSFMHFLKHYHSVYVKPNMSHMGKGIMKVWESKGKYRLVKVKGQIKKFINSEALFDVIRKETASSCYIVQKTIDLATIDGRPFDIRVMMMRDSNNRWQYTGMLAKVAGQTSIITNVNRGGGYAVSVNEALTASLRLSKQEQIKVMNELISLSHRICKRFIGYKYSSQIGIDFAIDQKRKIWIIEVNFDFPSHGLFAKLTDKSMYRKIKAIRRSYLMAYRAGQICRK
jgi:hypothetical protein